MITRTQKRTISQILAFKKTFTPWQKSKLSESHNLLKIIFDVKQDQIMKTKTIKKPVKKQFLLERQEAQSDQQEKKAQENEQYTNIKSLSFKNFLQRRKIIIKQIEEPILYPQFITSFLEVILKKTQHIKSEIKKRKGLCTETLFIPQSSHTCQYCGKTFAKPCALGGHISKLHSSARKKAKEAREANESQFVTPVKKRSLFNQ